MINIAARDVEVHGATASPPSQTALTRHAKIEVPLVCGPMYPCSNPELVAAVSRAGAIGVVQPIALTYVHGHKFRDGVRLINRLAAGRPIGFNALIEASSTTYHHRMVQWVEIALEEGVRFFITSLGNPRWVVERVHAAGGVVYHDVTEKKWALKGRDGGVDGLVAVSRDAGGHTGSRSAATLFDEIADLGLPVIAAGGVGNATQFRALLDLGYAGVQLGTRFRLFRGRTTKHWMRTFYALRSLHQLKRSNATGAKPDYWQAGRSVESIHDIVPAATIVRAFAEAIATTPGAA